MKEVGLRSSFTLALQTLDATALEAMNRRNMKVNDWQDLVEWLTAEGLDLYAELIWGSPGETVETFLRGYDELSEKVSRIAVYPMMLLPNTDFSERRSEFDIVALRGDSDDFEYILSHSTMSFDDDLRMQTFMFWARVIAENAVLRHIWRPLRQFGGMTQTKALDSLAQWIAESSSPAAKFVRIKCLQVKGGGAPAYAEVISFFFLTQDGENLLDDWWHGAVVPQLSAESEPFLSEVLRFDLLTCPVPGADAGATFAEGTVKTPPPLQDVEGEQFYVNGPIRFSYDIPVALESLRRGDTKLPAPRKADLTIYYREGALNAIMSTNHEEIVHFMGETDLARVLVPRGGAQEVG